MTAGRAAGWVAFCHGCLVLPHVVGLACDADFESSVRQDRKWVAVCEKWVFSVSYGVSPSDMYILSLFHGYIL